MTDGDLAALRDNAQRLVRRGSPQQQQNATALLPSIEAEMTSRRATSGPAKKVAKKAAKPAAAPDHPAAEPAPLVVRGSTDRALGSGGMTEHAFRVGQIVQFPAKREIGRDAARRDYKVERLLPADEGGDAQYRIRSVLDGTERIVREPEVISRGA
jgi:hypothetical protein